MYTFDESRAEYARAVIVPSTLKFLYKYPELKVSAFTPIEPACLTLLLLETPWCFRISGHPRYTGLPS
jgi:hypothetical protein